jgi:hypothetical protein
VPAPQGLIVTHWIVARQQAGFTAAEVAEEGGAPRPWSEAVRQAQRGATVEGGAYEVLRLAPRRRAVIELALAQLKGDHELDGATQEAATAILGRVLSVGLLF